MPSTSAPSKTVTEAWLYNGHTAVRRAVTLRRGDGHLIVADGGGEIHVATAELVHLESRADAEVYGRSETPGWRLGVPRPVPPEMATLLPQRQVYGRWIDRVGLGKALAIGIAVSAAVLFMGHQAPKWIAPHVPYSWEQKFGDLLVGDLGAKFCTGKGGQDALNAMTARLTSEPGKYKVRVVPLAMVNAMALPGGNIVIFDELLQKAESPDEVAGVLAHEIGHVEKLHVTQAMIRYYGFSALLASIGGTAGSNIDMLTAASYSREAEKEADLYSIEGLRRANISPLPTATFFKRLSSEEEGGFLDETLGYISTHPLSKERQQRFEQSAKGSLAYDPSLTPAEWDSLKRICK